MNNVLDYIYYGEVQVYQDDLDRFLMIAERMKLEGLMAEEKEDGKFEVAQNDMKEIKTLKSNESIETFSDRSRMEKTVIVSSDHFNSIDELDLKIEENIEIHGKQWMCKICHRICRFKSHAKEHAEIHFDGLSFPCQSCDKSFRSRLSFRKHMTTHKTDNKILI